MIAKTHTNWRDAFYITPDAPIYDWLEKNITIPPTFPGNFSGPYRIDLTPYLRGIFEAIRDPKIETITVMKGAQTGLSLLLQGLICWIIVEDPSPVAMFLPTGTLARSISETRLQILIENNPIVRAELHDDPDKFKKLEYITKRCNVMLSGANNATQTSSHPKRWVIVDETDKIPRDGNGEASPIKLAVERAKTFWNKKKIYVSTPTTKSGFIYKSYELGDQRKLFCKCHACGHEQVLRWSIVKFNSDGSNARYTCEECNADWSRIQTIASVNSAVWKPTAENILDTKHASFHLPSFYSRWVDVGELAIEFLQCKDEPKELQNLINSTFAEPFEVIPKKSTEHKTIWALRDMLKYDRGIIPFTSGKCFLVMCVDVQDKYCPFAVWAIGERDHALIDHGNLATPDDVVSHVLEKSYRRGDADVKIKMAVIDTGYRTDEAYEACIKLSRRGIVVVPVKGEKGAITSQSEPIKTQRIGSYPDGKPLPYSDSILLRHVHPRYFHDIAWSLLDPPESKDGKTSADVWLERKVRVYFHGEIDREYSLSITAETLVESEEDRSGRTKMLVKVLRRDNHQFDNFRYSLVARYMLKEDLKPTPVRSNTDKEKAKAGGTFDRIVIDSISLNG